MTRNRWLTREIASDAISILIEFYGAQELQGSGEFLTSVASVSIQHASHRAGFRFLTSSFVKQIPPPLRASHREKLYKPFSTFAAAGMQPGSSSTPEHAISQGAAPVQPGGATPGKPVSGGWKPVSEGAPAYGQ